MAGLCTGLPPVVRFYHELAWLCAGQPLWHTVLESGLGFALINLCGTLSLGLDLALCYGALLL